MLILLTKGMFAIVDDQDTHLAAFSWYALKRNNSWHAARTEKRDGKKRTVYMHRQLLNEPVGYEIDHADGNGLNNQRANLRLATKAQNKQNCRQLNAKKSSQFHGVCWNKSRGRWRVVICAGTRDARGYAKQLYVGTFRDEQEAARAYDDAARAMFGEFAVTNFPLEQRVS